MRLRDPRGVPLEPRDSRERCQAQVLGECPGQPGPPRITASEEDVVLVTPRITLALRELAPDEHILEDDQRERSRAGERGRHDVRPSSLPGGENRDGEQSTWIREHDVLGEQDRGDGDGERHEQVAPPCRGEIPQREEQHRAMQEQPERVGLEFLRMIYGLGVQRNGGDEQQLRRLRREEPPCEEGSEYRRRNAGDPRNRAQGYHARAEGDRHALAQRHEADGTYEELHQRLSHQEVCPRTFVEPEGECDDAP